MIESVRQAAPPPPPPPPAAIRSPIANAAPYAAAWNPPAAPPPPPPAPPQPEARGFLDRLGTAITSGDVRSVASTVRDGIGDATEAGRNGITSAVNWTGETIGNGADLARSHITGDGIISQGLRGAVDTVEATTRFSVGVSGGVLREGVGLVGSVGQLGTTLAEVQVSAEARQELTQNVVGAVGTAGDYVAAGLRDPARVGSDLQGAWDATTGFVGSTADRYGQAIAEGRTEEIGMDVGAVATYVVPVGGGPARALLGAGTRAGAEGVARGGATLAAREGVATSVVREALPGATRQAANDVAPSLRAANDAVPSLRQAASDIGAPPPPAGRAGALPDVPPSPLSARAQLAEHVYGAGRLPGGTSVVTDAAELGRLNLTPQMLDRGAFHAEVYRSGAPGSEAYTIAFRGSGPRLGDWVTNGLQGAGLPSNHYARALEIGRAISRTDASIPVEFVGHSLGGGLASHAANAAGREATTFNAAGLHFISQAQGRQVAREAGIAPGFATNHSVPGEFLTTAQEALSPIVPRAFGTTHRLPGTAPDGAGFLAQFGPMAPINRHMMEWVIASTGR